MARKGRAVLAIVELVIKQYSQFNLFRLTRFFLPVSATADNCLLTNYPFLALHRSDYHIVCEQKPEMVANGDDNASISTGNTLSY